MDRTTGQQRSADDAVDARLMSSVRGSSMRKMLQLAVALSLAVLSAGCATPYMTDRARDAADVLTCAACSGGGVKARVGPIGTGLFLGMNYEQLGLRGGYAGRLGGGDCLENMLDVDVIYGQMERFVPYDCPTVMLRGKAHLSDGYLGLNFAYPCPSTTLVYGEDRFVVRSSWRQTIPQWTRIEAVFGFPVSLRLGFNPGELLDLILGWTTIDVFDDDLERKKREWKKTSGGDVQRVAPDSHRSMP